MKFNVLLTTIISVLLITAMSKGSENAAPSFSFQYDSQHVSLKSECGPVTSNDSFKSWTKKYTAPDGKLQIILKGRDYLKFPVTEYTVELTNLSKKDATGLIADFRTLNSSLPLSNADRTVSLNILRGSICQPIDFEPLKYDLPKGKKQVFGTPSGRSSNEFVPFIELNLSEKSGWLYAIAWTGSWSAQFENTGTSVNVELGMDNTNFRLLPGETVRLPGVTIFKRSEMTRRQFKTTVRRFMVEHKSPRDSKGNVIPPILAEACGGGNKTPEMMQNILQYALDNKIPFNTYWIDAGWYGAPHEDELYSNCGPNWWKYVGDWRINTTTHPSGSLLPIADAVHKAGWKFLLWFEPERIRPESPILKEHPEFRNDDLLDLGNPAALKWIQETVYGIIAKHKIDIYREDFNMDPGPVWEKKDKANPERVGIAEMKHIANLYVFLDEMRNRFPDILQENCSSGGRRIDIEMISRAHSYCRSDYFIGQKPNDQAFILGQNASLNLMPYLPFQGCEFNCVPVHDNYAAFSIISTGTVITPSDFDGGIIRRKLTNDETAWFKKIFDTARRMMDSALGDFYQLTDETSANNEVWCGWQFDTADKNEGYALVFRRGKAQDAEKVFALGNIDKNANYEIEIFDGAKKTVKGSELANWKVNLEPRSFRLMFYKKVK